MEIKQFKTESKRLLDLMINSIYTNKEIFLRELISNASDAIDKYHVLSLNDDNLVKETNYQINIEVDKKNRTITIKDNGIGMNKEELEENLGTIANSGSKAFLEKISDEKLKNEMDIIGQFGVGFYSAFMVASKIEVKTKSPYSEQGYLFLSEGEETYSIDECEKLEHGSEITLYLRENNDEENYDKFMESYEIEHLVKKYSDYIRYPILMMVETSKPKLDANNEIIENEYETVSELKTLNSMTPIWKKKKNEVSEEELNDFYKQKFNDFEDPLLTIFFNVEGMLTYNALIYIPAKAPYNLYSEKYEKGLQLYTKGVFIKDSCKELVPDYLRFIKGLVDSSDLSLNISREMLQHTRQLEKIANSIEKKVLSELTKLKENDYDKYLKFFKEYGINFKYGIYNSFGTNKDKLQDLLVYKSINQEKEITLETYVNNIKENQEFIYYASMKTKEQVLAMPQMDKIKKLGYDVLILQDDIDEFTISILQEYKGKKFKSVNQGDLDVLSKEEEEAFNSLKETKQPLLTKIKEILQSEVSDVVLSKRLQDSPVCLVSSENGVSFEMEKAINAMPLDDKVHATKILEINPNHDLFKAIEKAYDNNSESLKDYATLLYNNALLMEGFNIKDPASFTNLMAKLIIENANKK
ncbi:MAG: molecular chaperone HtpG [Bacilli bacterium]|nr:molecular chaperone HtpG [Bacilli bacterium]